MRDASDHTIGNQPPATGGIRARVFATTQWSLFRELRQSDPARSAAALSALCRTYWQPVYVCCLRRRGGDRYAAEDLTQAFFEHLLEHETLSRAAPEQGRFRTFLQAALQYFLANEWDKRRALKRGGQFQFISLDQAVFDGLAEEPPDDAPSPEGLFDRQWAGSLVRQTFDRLRRDYTEKGRGELFRLLEPAITRPDTDGACAAAAARLGLTEGAAREALHRLRRRFGDFLRQEVCQTITRVEDVDDELRHLLTIIVR